MAQKTGSLLHIAFRHQLADVSRTDGDAVQSHLRDDIAAQTQLSTAALKQLRRSLILIAKVKIVSGHQMGGVLVLDQE